MSSGPATVLVVDDDEATRGALISLLESEGYRALGVGDGAQALAACEKELPNLILLDLMMPVMDGWEFLEQWRARRPPDARCPVVLLSGLSFIRDAPGVADFLPKPIDVSRLRSCLQRFLD